MFRFSICFDVIIRKYLHQNSDTQSSLKSILAEILYVLFHHLYHHLYLFSDKKFQVHKITK